MAKGDTVLVPVVLEARDPEELAKMVVTERVKRNQIAATAHYTAIYVPRFHGVGYTKYVAFVEFMVEEK